MSGLPNAHVPACDVSGSIRRRLILGYVDARRVVDVALRRLQLFETQVEGQSVKVYDLVRRRARRDDLRFRSRPRRAVLSPARRMYRPACKHARGARRRTSNRPITVGSPFDRASVRRVGGERNPEMSRLPQVYETFVCILQQLFSSESVCSGQNPHSMQYVRSRRRFDPRHSTNNATTKLGTQFRRRCGVEHESLLVMLHEFSIPRCTPFPRESRYGFRELACAHAAYVSIRCQRDKTYVGLNNVHTQVKITRRRCDRECFRQSIVECVTDRDVVVPRAQVNQTVYKFDNATGTLISLMVYSIRSSPIYACVFIIKILPCDIRVSADN